MNELRFLVGSHKKTETRRVNSLTVRCIRSLCTSFLDGRSNELSSRQLSSGAEFGRPGVLSIQLIQKPMLRKIPAAQNTDKFLTLICNAARLVHVISTLKLRNIPLAQMPGTREVADSEFLDLRTCESGAQSELGGGISQSSTHGFVERSSRQSLSWEHSAAAM